MAKVAKFTPYGVTMTKFLLLLAVLLAAQSFSFSPLAQATPCETYEPNCDGEDERRGNGWDDDAEPQRPEDRDGPDYDGDDSDI